VSNKELRTADLDTAQKHLNGISSDDAEFNQVKALQKTVDRKRKALEKMAAEHERRIPIVARQLFGEALEKKYLSEGMDVHIEVYGKDNTSFKMRYILLSRPMIYRLENET
jgi:hypothetical protein